MGRKVWNIALFFGILFVTSLHTCNGDASWEKFASNPNVTDSRLVVPENFFSPRLTQKDSSVLWVRMDCSHACAIQDACYAFNFCETEKFFECELLYDEPGNHSTASKLIKYPGCSVWEKMVPGVKSLIPISYELATTSSLSTTTNPPSNSDIRTSALIMCASVRNGCLGIFPNCYGCIKTCIDWHARDDLIDRNVALWPDGDGPDSVPVYTQCWGKSTMLADRHILLANGTETMNFLIPFRDMNRIVNLKVYRYLQIVTGRKSSLSTSAAPIWDYSTYSNFYIGPEGTLANLTYFSANGSSTTDVFNLGGKPMPPTPFVNVTDDRYSCGSFWLLDATNATYCPGGKLGMFGTVRKNGTKVLNTGMRVPIKPTDFTFSALILLMV